MPLSMVLIQNWGGGATLHLRMHKKLMLKTKKITLVILLVF